MFLDLLGSSAELIPIFALGGVEHRQLFQRKDLARSCLYRRLRRTYEQRLRLGDLGHLGRRRKAFERRREDGVGVGGAAGRLVKLGERQRREQCVPSGALSLRDGDGGLEGVFGWRRLGGIELEQEFAARSVDFAFECAVACALARRQCLLENGQRAFRIAARAPRPRPARS